MQIEDEEIKVKTEDEGRRTAAKDKTPAKEKTPAKDKTPAKEKTPTQTPAKQSVAGKSSRTKNEEEEVGGIAS